MMLLPLHPLTIVLSLIARRPKELCFQLGIWQTIYEHATFPSHVAPDSKAGVL